MQRILILSNLIHAGKSYVGDQMNATVSELPGVDTTAAGERMVVWKRLVHFSIEF